MPYKPRPPALERLMALKCRAMLVACDGNRQLAARRLGISRYTLWRILKRDNERLDRE